MDYFIPIKGYEGSYSVTFDGLVISHPSKTRKESKFLKLFETKSGYLIAELCKEGVRKKHLVHRLVAEAYIPNPNNKEQVNHKDGWKRNNRADNLEWATRSENQKHAIENGLRSAKGEKNSQSKLNEEMVKHIRVHASCGWDKKKLADMFGVSLGTVYDIIARRSWSHV